MSDASLFESDMAEIQEFVRDLRAQRQELEARTAAARKANSEAEEERADARRRGELGREWQALQQRIDLRQTTFSDIMNGLDHSTEAAAVRKTMGEGLAVVRSVYSQHASDPRGPLAPALGAVADAQKELAETLRAADLLGGGH